jgi:hypothetical protein
LKQFSIHDSALWRSVKAYSSAFLRRAVFGNGQDFPFVFVIQLGGAFAFSWVKYPK